MAKAQVPNVPLTKPQRKSYFPFEFGMRSQPDQGVGALNAINALCNKDGHVEKTKGIGLIKDILGVDQITALYEYKKSDGDVQIIAVYRVDVPSPADDFYVMRVVEEDLTVGTPLGAESSLTGTFTFTTSSTAVSATGGKFLSELAVGDWIYASGESGNAAQVASITDDENLVLEIAYTGAGVSAAGKMASVHFTGSQFDFTPLGGKTFVSNDSTTTPLYSFDGTTLTKIANVTEKIYSIATDSNHIAAVFRTRTDFSGDDIATSDDFKSGTGVNRFGTYGSSIAYPKAVVEGGDGIIIFAEVGSESHQVIPNAASDDVSSKTINSSYKHKGIGISHPRQIVNGEYFVYFGNTDGCFELNPYTGQVKELTDVGAVKGFWASLKKDFVVAGYDPSNQYIVFIAQEYGQSDTMLCFDISQKKRPCWYSESQYHSSLAIISGRLYGGSSRDGKIYKIFEGPSDFGASTQLFKYRLEKDGLGGVPFLKTFRKFVVYSELHPRSEFTARVFLNDETIPIFEKTLGTTNTSVKGGTVEQYGRYVFRLGSVISDTVKNNIRLNQKNARFNRVSIEIEERSSREFKLKDIVIEYKSRGRFVRKFLSKDVS